MIAPIPGQCPDCGAPVHDNIVLLPELSLNEYQRSMHTYKKAHEECHALGIAGELAEVFKELYDTTLAAGSIADIVKKSVSHGVKADRSKLLKELGDVLWYVAAVARDNDITLEEVATANLQKLRERYPEGFVKGGGVREQHPGVVRQEPFLSALAAGTIGGINRASDSAKQPCGATYAGEGSCNRSIDHEGPHSDSHKQTIWDRAEIPAVLCEHANECPSVCLCPPHCYCRRVGSAPSCRVKRKLNSVHFSCGCSETQHPNGTQSIELCADGNCRRLRR